MIIIKQDLYSSGVWQSSEPNLRVEVISEAPQKQLPGLRERRCVHWAANHLNP